ncbi:hypothetical protein K431DRAFT_309975 [Polychaeton citri CBS 116435]|uniref:Impact N-terminal domain-containing protein n=1 Tax=Polychaeton citri CBS 116435 TaxID=1314669 RepID=A0A9P4QBY7_9PEZI|nr:hypothetical protein K431DRAFT_309975 [Polychaeton citri CBS 116435]
MSAKRKRSPSPSTTTTTTSTSNQDLPIVESDPIDDRLSRFIGYYSPTLPPKELQSFLSAGNPSHKILGWRRESNQQSLTKTKQYVSGHDDDGEQYGGKKVENVLKAMEVTGACVVARWYGGVLLGPRRFEHIEAAARGAVERWVEVRREEEAKKRKVEEEARERPKAAETLRERDKSILVLRRLAAEKEAEAKRMREDEKNEGDSSAATPPSSSAVSKPPVTPDYDAMSLNQLRAMEKARDATLSFLLKRIDKAEAELATSGKPP